MFSNNLQLQPSPPPSPPTYNVGRFVTGYAHVTTRQTALEPTGAMSWSIWFFPSSINAVGQHLFQNCLTTATTRQYACFIADMTTAGAGQNGLSFTIFTNASNTINIIPSVRLLKNRWTHIVITYNGSGSNTGIECYFNGVLDASPTRGGAGTFTAPLNNASLRVQLGNVFTSAQRLRGTVRDFAIWNDDLSQSEVTELFNNGLPVSVPSVSFYGAKIVSYWAMQTDATSAQSASFNFGTTTGLTFGTSTMSAYYQYLTMVNANVANTRYVAFGTTVRISRNSVFFYERSGTSHLDNGRIDKFNFIPKNIGVNANLSPVTVYTDPSYDLRHPSAGRTFDFISIGTSQYDSATGTWNNNQVIESTDGLTGETFGSPITITPPTSSANAYGEIIRKSAGNYILPNNAGVTAGTYYLSYFESNAPSTWGANVPVYSSSTVYVEGAIVNCGNGTMIMLHRNNAGGGLHMSYTTNGGATWSTPAATNLGGASAVCMADVCLNDVGNLNVIYADRDDNTIRLSANTRVATVLANPAAFNAGIEIFSNVAGGTILGYPTICNIGRGYFAIGFSIEISASRADLFIGYGLIR